MLRGNAEEHRNKISLKSGETCEKQWCRALLESQSLDDSGSQEGRCSVSGWN